MLPVKRILLLIICWLLFSTQALSEERSSVLKVGIVPQFDKTQLRYNWEPLLFLLAKKLNMKIRFVDSSSISEFEKKLEQGEFDLAYMNPYHFLAANKQQGYIPLVRDVGKSLRGILVARRDSDITNVKQLDGKIVAFPAPSAFAATMLTRTELQQQYGISVKPLYLESHTATYLHVLLGRSIAGAGVLNTYKKQPKDIQDALRVIYTTEQVVTHPIAVHPRLPEEKRNKIKSILLQLGNNVDGKAALARIPFIKLGATSVDEYRLLEKKGLAP